MWAQIWKTIAGWFKELFGGKSGSRPRSGREIKLQPVQPPGIIRPF